IFLDEVGEIPLETQVKLLRVLQEQEFEPVGSNQTVRVDVRVIAATNRDLEEAVRAGRFRADLFYRLNVFPLRVPPLRERASDIPQLAMFFLSRFAKRFGRQVATIASETMDRLVSYPWPGNIRELQNVIERAVVLSRGPTLELDRDLLLPIAPLKVSEFSALSRPALRAETPSTELAPVERRAQDRAPRPEGRHHDARARRPGRRPVGGRAEPVLRADPGCRRHAERRSRWGLVRRPRRRGISAAAESAGRGAR